MSWRPTVTPKKSANAVSAASGFGVVAGCHTEVIAGSSTPARSGERPRKTVKLLSARMILPASLAPIFGSSYLGPCAGVTVRPSWLFLSGGSGQRHPILRQDICGVAHQGQRVRAQSALPPDDPRLAEDGLRRFLVRGAPCRLRNRYRPRSRFLKVDEFSYRRQGKPTSVDALGRRISNDGI